MHTNSEPDYKLVPTRPLTERLASRAKNEELVTVTVQVPAGNAQEIQDIAAQMRADAGLFLSEDLIV